MQEIRQKYYFPSIAIYVRNWIRDCDLWFQGKRINNTRITDPNAIDFNESYTQGPDTVIAPRSYFHDSSDGLNRETYFTSDPSVVHPPMPKSHGQIKDVETATNLGHKDS